MGPEQLGRLSSCEGIVILAFRLLPFVGVSYN
jgi:hypothetical protein